jgi:hypothetical protein
MNFPPGIRITEKDKHRLHDRLNTLLVSVAAITIAFNYVTAGEAKFEVGHVVNVAAKSAGAYMYLPLANVFETALVEKYPEQIEIDFLLGQQSDIIPVAKSGGFISVLTNIFAPVFVKYYETYANWLYSTRGKQINWPSVWQFARLVRNSIHGGKISYGNEKNPAPVTWCGLTYTKAADEGRQLIGGDMTVGDLVVMLFEMDDELNNLGCPFQV